MTISEFETYISELKIARTVLSVQEHHTWKPSYAHFNGSNHFELQKNMRNHHVHNNGWSDIGQHISIFPDGTIVTGRSFERSPACIYGQNSNAFCIENIGDFDSGKDTMNSAQEQSIVRVTAALCRKFGLAINTNSIVYHHWFNLSTGQRNNGTGSNKSCPGTNFFGGNKVDDCETNFLPQVEAAFNSLNGMALNTPVLKYVCIDSAKLNVRVGPHYKKAIARSALSRGVVVRVFEIADNGWLKISSKEDHWISGKFTYKVFKATVTSAIAHSHLGPNEASEITSQFIQGEDVFINDRTNGWWNVNMTLEWINETDISIENL